jgi:hypothetical protein
MATFVLVHGGWAIRRVMSLTVSDKHCNDNPCLSANAMLR